MAGLLHFSHAMQTARECSECHRVLPLTEEYFYKRRADPIAGLQHICRSCHPKANLRSKKIREADAQRAADTEAREQRETMILLHERGRHENAPNENCPVCRAEAGWMKPNFPPSGSAAAQ